MQKKLVTYFVALLAFLFIMNANVFGSQRYPKPGCEPPTNGAADEETYYNTLVEARDAMTDDQQKYRADFPCAIPIWFDPQHIQVSDTEFAYTMVVHADYCNTSSDGNYHIYYYSVDYDDDCYCEDGADSDGDGTPDECDGCPDNNEIIMPDPDCGCDKPEDMINNDGDGLPDCREECDLDPDKTEPGVCGCGVPDDTDVYPLGVGNGIPDCLENDKGHGGGNGPSDNGPSDNGPGDNGPNDEQHQGDPINIFTGNNFISKTDIIFNSPFVGGFSFKRWYNSQSDKERAAGYGWTHSYSASLITEVDEAKTIIKIINNSGRGCFFQDDGTKYAGMEGEQSYVEKIGDTYVWKLTSGNSYTFDSEGLLQSITDINGNTQVLSYDTDSLLKTVTDQASGRVITFHYNSSFRIDHISGPVTSSVLDGIWVTYGYDTNGNLNSVTYADGSGYTFQYNDPNDTHNITEMYDKESHFLNSWAYDVDDRAYESVNRNGLGATIDYTDMNNIKSTDDYGETRTFTITEINGRKVITDIASDSGKSVVGPGVVKYVYNTDRYIDEKHYENGRIDKFQNLDSRGNPQTIITAFGTTKEETVYFTWHPTLTQKLSRTETSLLASGNHETIWDYDDDYDDISNEAPTNRIYRLIEKGYTYDETGAAVAFEHITTYYYNTKGQLTDIDGPLDGDQDKTTLGYDPVTGDRLTITNSIGTTSFLTDAAGNIETATDVNDILTTLTYDGKNRILTSTRDGKTSARTYTLSGEIETITDAELRTLTYAYETQYGHLDKTTDVPGNYHQYGYDTHGNINQDFIYDSTATLQKKNNYNYEGTDLPGKLWKQINFDGSFVAFGYNSAGNRTSVTSADNKTTLYTYDNYNRVETITQPGTIVTSFTYDANGNLATVTDGDNKITSYTYDDTGRLVKTVSPDTGTTLYTYNKAGNLLTKKVNSGLVTTYTYDDPGRITGIIYSDTSENVTFTYDEGVNGKGRLTGKAGQDYLYAYTYNAMGQLVTEIKTIGTASYTTEYSYDNAGILTGMIYPDGRTVTYGQNTNGQYLSVSTTKAAVTDQLVSNAAYKPFGPTTGFQFDNGIIYSKAYDLGYNLSNITAGSVQNLTYTPDVAGKISAITNNLDATRNQSFGYDDLNRLETASGIYGSFSYTYDNTGNRQTMTKNSVTDAYTYLPGTSIINAVTGSSPKSFMHDADGNILEDMKIETGLPDVTTSEYIYNDAGQRLRKISGSLVIYYHYDLGGNLIAETDATGLLVKAYIYMGGIRIATIAADGSICYYHNNHLETPEVMTNQSGSVVWKADYLPFGKADVDPASTVVNDFRFPGQIFDGETGYHYNWNRYYDTETGRYVTADPIGLLGGVNLYGYVLNDPVNLIDPEGLMGAAQGAQQFIYANGPAIDKTGRYILDTFGGDGSPNELAAAIQILDNAMAAHDKYVANLPDANIPIKPIGDPSDYQKDPMERYLELKEKADAWDRIAKENRERLENGCP